MVVENLLSFVLSPLLLLGKRMETRVGLFSKKYILKVACSAQIQASANFPARYPTAIS